ncbi:MAG: hypothetical protein LBK06_08845, partial [Planctomycetaceae bacterium]|nr:hypothetical protein [Planctomycetaceae bacterium]
ALEIVNRNWLLAVSQQRFEFPELNMSPFVTKIELDENICEYHASCVDLFSMDAAYKLWNQLDIAVARAAYDRWLRSSDASFENPVNRECAMLRQCMEEVNLVTESLLDVTEKLVVTISPSKPKRTRDDAKRKLANRLVALDGVAQKIIDAALSNKKIPSYIDICEQLIQKGKLNENQKTFRNFLIENKPLKTLKIWAKKRPKLSESREYQKWLESFNQAVKFFNDQLVQREDEGLTVQERKTNIIVPVEKTNSKPSKGNNKLQRKKKRTVRKIKTYKRVIKYRASYAVNLIAGKLGIRTKNGFISFQYDELIQWAKNQGTKSPYKRLYTPLPTPSVPYRQFPRNRCGQRCLKSRCCCHVLIRNANNQPQRPLFPVKREIKLWKRSERRRKKRQQILGLRSCPRCPKSKGLCALYPPPKDMAAL